MPRHFYPGHHKQGFGRRRYHSLNSLVWIIGLWVLFTTHSWWPGIMILVGITMVLNTLANSDWAAQATDRPAEVEESTPWQDWTRQPPPPPPPSPALQPDSKQPVVQSPPPEPDHYSGWLPATCPSCGAPIRPQTVRWTGSQSADCAYCGSVLPRRG